MRSGIAGSVLLLGLACQTYDFEKVEPIAIAQTRVGGAKFARKPAPNLMLLGGSVGLDARLGGGRWGGEDRRAQGRPGLVPRTARQAGAHGPGAVSERQHLRRDHQPWRRGSRRRFASDDDAALAASDATAQRIRSAVQTIAPEGRYAHRRVVRVRGRAAGPAAKTTAATTSWCCSPTACRTATRRTRTPALAGGLPLHAGRPAARPAARTAPSAASTRTARWRAFARWPERHRSVRGGFRVGHDGHGAADARCDGDRRRIPTRLRRGRRWVPALLPVELGRRVGDGAGRHQHDHGTGPVRVPPRHADRDRSEVPERGRRRMPCSEGRTPGSSTRPRTKCGFRGPICDRLRAATPGHEVVVDDPRAGVAVSARAPGPGARAGGVVQGAERSRGAVHADEARRRRPRRHHRG